MHIVHECEFNEIAFEDRQRWLTYLVCYCLFQISHSLLEDLAEKSLKGLAKSLESLAIVSARLKFIPRTTLSTMKRLKTLDLEGNLIDELGPYSFHNILLQKVTLYHYLFICKPLISHCGLYTVFFHSIIGFSIITH